MIKEITILGFPIGICRILAARNCAKRLSRAISASSSAAIFTVHQSESPTWISVSAIRKWPTSPAVTATSSRHACQYGSPSPWKKKRYGHVLSEAQCKDREDCLDISEGQRRKPVLSIIRLNGGTSATVTKCGLLMPGSRMPSTAKSRRK